MKHNKIFAVLALAATLTLAACGGGNGSTSAKPSSGSKQTPTTSKEPPKPVKAASIDDVKLAKKDDGKVYVQLKGSETLYTAADKLEYAFGVTAGDGTVPEATEENPNPSDEEPCESDKLVRDSEDEKEENNKKAENIAEPEKVVNTKNLLGPDNDENQEN